MSVVPQTCGQRQSSEARAQPWVPVPRMSDSSGAKPGRIDILAPLLPPALLSVEIGLGIGVGILVF